MKQSFSKNIAVTILISVVLLLLMQTYFINEVDRISREQAVTYADTIAGQMEESMNAMLKNVTYSALYLSENSITKNFLQQKDPYERYQLEQYISDTFRTVLALDSYVTNIILMDSGENIVYAHSSVGYGSYGTIKEEVQNSPGDGNRKFFVAGTGMRDFLVCYVPLRFTGGPDGDGAIIFLLNIEEIGKLFQKVDSNEQVDLFLLDPGGAVIAANSDSAKIEEKEGNMYLERNLREEGFRVICQIDGGAVSGQYTFFRTSNILVAAVMIALLAVIGMLFNKTIASPIQRMMAEVGGIDGRNDKKRIEGNYGAQLGPLVTNINAMLDKTTRLNQQLFEEQEKIYTQELLRRESDLYALRNQINPHFLFNTLQSIGGAALMHGQRDIASITAGMADIFYYALKGGDTVLAEDELSMLTKYLKIMQFRFQEKFRWEIDVPEHIRQYPIPKMLLQPLVENAITHGIEKRTDAFNGLLRLTATETGEYVDFIVTDNGLLSEEKITELRAMLADEQDLYREIRSKKGIGLANIQYRVKIIYGSACGLRICREDGNTQITLTIKKSIPDTGGLPSLREQP